MTASVTNQMSSLLPNTWDEEADVIIVGYGFAGSAAAIAAHDAGATVLLLEKAPEQYKGGNSRVNAQILFWPNDIEKAKTYFKALAGPYMDNISEEMVEVWATEMHANRAYLEGLGMKPILAHKGKLNLSVTVRGMTGHSSEPSKGVNAVQAAGEAIASPTLGVDEREYAELSAVDASSSEPGLDRTLH